ncbi:MAG TPA: mechanosensitive ion channel [Thermoanaerobaculia bacterium]|nr:mechanosensitive ion channel [Thermoanaerobaculia bacterium]
MPEDSATLAHLLPALGAALGAFALAALASRLLARGLALMRPFSLPLYVAALALGFKVYTLFETAPRRALAADGFYWCLLFFPLALVLRLATLYFFEIHLKSRRALALPPLLPAVAVATGYMLVALLTLPLVFENADFKAFFATSAVTSLVLGLALQPILTNFFAGLVISVERSFGINDWIRVGDQEGRVVAITWRTTHLRTRDNDHLIIPNAKIAEERVLNFGLPHRLHLERVVVGADYRTPPYRVRRALLDAAAGLDGVLETPTPEVYVLGFEESAINYELRLWLEDYAARPRISSDARQRIWEAFHRAGITIPFPIRTVELAPRKASAAEAQLARLFVTEGAERGVSVAIPERGLTVGRSRSCALCLSDAHASKEHLRIEVRDGGYWLIDLGSSFGTKINGLAVEEARLQHFDRIQIGEAVIVFEQDAGS